MDHFAMLIADTLHDLLYSKGYNCQERFIKDLWNPLWTTRNSRWATSGPPVPRWESLP